MKGRKYPRVLVETVTRNVRDLRQDWDDDDRAAAMKALAPIPPARSMTDSFPDLPSSTGVSEEPRKVVADSPSASHVQSRHKSKRSDPSLARELDAQARRDEKRTSRPPAPAPAPSATTRKKSSTSIPNIGRLDTRPKVFASEDELLAARAMFPDVDDPASDPSLPPAPIIRRASRQTEAVARRDSRQLPAHSSSVGREAVRARETKEIPALPAEARATARTKNTEKVSELRREIGVLREEIALLHGAMATEAEEHDVSLAELDALRLESEDLQERYARKERELLSVAALLAARETELRQRSQEVTVLTDALAREVENDEKRCKRITELERALKIAEVERDGLRGTLNLRERELTQSHDQKIRAVRRLEELMGMLHFLDIVEAQVATIRDSGLSDSAEAAEVSAGDGASISVDAE